MKKVYISKSKKPVKKTKSRLEVLKEKKAKKVKSNSKLNRKKLRKRIIRVTLVLAGIFVIVSLIGGLLVLAYLQDKNDEIPSPDQVFPELPLTSEIYDRLALEEGQSGTRLYRVIGQFNSDQVDISEIPDHVKLAFIAAEDKDFYIHGGFDPIAILRCGIYYVKNNNESCGGSTITQQLVKLTTQRSERALERKIEEMLLAVKVEQSYDKDQILEMYLRVTPFGSSIVGIKTAANFYYGKEPKDLTLAEAATLASIIQNPPYLSPTLPIDGNKEAAQQRLKDREAYVLDQLEKNADKFNNDLRTFYNDPERDDVITAELVEEARNEDWQSKLRPPVATDKKAGHFVNYVLNLLQTRNYKNGTEPFTLSDLQTGGYKIYTTLDYNIQQIAERYVAKGGNDFSYWNVNNAAVMTTIPGTGQIISMAGSKSFYGQKEGCDVNQQNCKYDPEVNVLTSLQEPGSSNKPMGYYLAYKEGKLFTKSLLPDVPIKLADPNGSTYEPKNWNGTFNGVNYTAEQALRDSRNIPAIEVAQMIGVSNYIQTAKDFGYTSYTGQYGPSVILGGVSVYSTDHAQAYGIYATGGDLVTLNPILKIVDKQGNVVYEATVEKKSVGDPQAIWLLNQTIKNYDNYSWDGRDMAGKTGTTEDSRDAWFVGYSPDFVNICWAGNNNNDPMNGTYGYPPYVIKPWCKDYLAEIGQSPYLAAKTPFNRPSGVYEGGGDCNEEGCMGLARGWMIEGRTPPRDLKKSNAVVCTDQQDKLARPMDIALGYSVEKSFTQYIMPVASLQKYLDEYLKSKGSENNALPTENCNIDRSGGVTGPFFASLSGNMNGNTINIKGSSYSNQGSMTALSFSVKSQGSASFTAVPGCTTTNYNGFDITCNLASIQINSGDLTLRAIGTDSAGNTNSKDLIVTVPSGFSFNTPSTNDTCTTACSRTLSATYSGGFSLSGVSFRVYKGNSLIATLPATGSGTYTANWVSTGTGAYKFQAVGTTSTGGKMESTQSATITVQ